jgi:hypothetical protein
VGSLPCWLHKMPRTRKTSGVVGVAAAAAVVVVRLLLLLVGEEVVVVEEAEMAVQEAV